MDFSIAPPSVDWGNVANYLIISDGGQELGRINLEASTGSVPAPQTIEFDLMLDQGFEGFEREFTVIFGTDSGHGKYLYKYIYRE